MNTKEKARRYDAQQTVDIFNNLFPVGSGVLLRKIANKEYPYTEYTVKDIAFVACSGEPVCFFDGISGCFSIDKKFIKYPKN